jgi:hypothetical protein
MNKTRSQEDKTRARKRKVKTRWDLMFIRGCFILFCVVFCICFVLCFCIG